MTFNEWLEKSEGKEWTELQTVAVLEHISQIEDTYVRMLRNAIDEATRNTWSGS